MRPPGRGLPAQGPQNALPRVAPREQRDRQREDRQETEKTLKHQGPNSTAEYFRAMSDESMTSAADARRRRS